MASSTPGGFTALVGFLAVLGSLLAGCVGAGLRKRCVAGRFLITAPRGRSGSGLAGRSSGLCIGVGSIPLGSAVTSRTRGGFPLILLRRLSLWSDIVVHVVHKVFEARN